MRRTLLALCLAILISLPFQTATAQPVQNGIDFPALDSYITGQMKKHSLQGVALAVIDGTEIIYQQGYGTAGGGQAMTPSTPMYIGSLSKSVTALAMVQLAERGLLDLDAPVRTYLPWFAVADAQASERITLSHLLHHISGLSDAGYSVILPADTSLEDGVRSLAAARLTANMGSKFQYFNMGYCVLNLVIQTVSGLPYEAYVQQNIFSPLQMSRTFTEPEPAQAAGLSQGYSRLFGFPIPWPQPHPQYQVAQGFIISTAEDLAHYAIAMNNAGVYAGQALAAPESIRKLFQPIQGYGLGWFVSAGHINHGGANETFKTYVDLYPDRDLGIVLLINQGYLMDHYISAGQLFSGVESIVLGRNPPDVAYGLSVRTIGWGMGLLILGLCALHTHNFLQLRGWKDRARRMSPVKLAIDVAISLLIPTLILLIVYSQLSNFFGDRFNLLYQLSMVFTVLPDIGLLMLVGTVPDYTQAVIKLYWVLGGKARASNQPLPVSEALQG